ncbi:MAG: ATP-dependent nuclease [Candidatus Dormibacteria bacterium]
MRLTRLEARNVLSFAEFEMDLNPRQTVIVGPNGSGKTNLTRLLALMGAALAWVETEGPRGAAVPPGAAAQILDGYARARHFPDNGGRQAVRIGLELTAEWERALVVAFVRAAVLSTVQEDMQQGQQHQDGLAEWVMATVTPAACDELFSGTLVAEHSGVPGMAWEVAFEFTHGTPGERYRWVLQAQRWHSTIMASATAMSPPPEITTGRGVLAQQIVGWTPGSPPLTSLPSLQPFSLDLICPAVGAAVSVAVGGSNQYLEASVTPYRDFLQLSGLEPGFSSRSLSIGAALWPIWRNGLALVGEQLRGVGTWGTALRPAGQYSWQDLSAPSPSREPHVLPLRLFRLKNGSAEDRERYGRIQEAFRTLAPERKLDVTFAAAGADASTSRTQTGQPADTGTTDVAQARVEVMVTKTVADWSLGSGGPSSEFPIQLHGAGTWEALILAEALYDAVGRVVVLDEPATTLHPAWQRSLGAQFNESEGQLVIITHSSHLVPMETADDLSHLVRFSATSGATREHRIRPALDKKPTATLLKEFSQSADARGMVFARGVVLVEGPSELAALPTWFSNSATAKSAGTPWDQDVAIVSVGGGANYRPFLSVLTALGIPWTVVCDGKAFAPGRDQIFKQVPDAEGGNGPLLESVSKVLSGRSDLDDTAFQQLKKIGDSVGIFTLATTWQDSTAPGEHEGFEGAVDALAPGKRREAAALVGGGSKVRIAHWVADNVQCPDEVDRLYGKILKALGAGG